MVTEFGKYLRKLRIDEGEILKTMADKLEVSSAFLSAVENGKKKIPKGWDEKIIQKYQLNSTMAHELVHAISHSQKIVEIDLELLNKDQKDIAFSFARSIERFNTEDLGYLRNFINKRSEGTDVSKR
ncbi:TPA: helix-turn-helix transcriptional regulator [Streptococcus suis]